MLIIFNNIKPFVEDCYLEIGVREYSRIVKVSAPTASKILKEFEIKGLLKKRNERGYLLFRTNRESLILRDLSRAYWLQKLKEVIGKINSKMHNPTIVLFGSLSKLEAKKDSDIDLAVFGYIKKKVDLSKYEKELGRKIQLFHFKSLEKINKELRLNIINSYLIQGELK